MTKTKKILTGNNLTANKKSAALLCAVFFTLAAGLPAFASFPLALGDWKLSSQHTVSLTGPEELGRWTSASYARAAPIASIEVQLTEGPGPGALFVPDGAVSSDDGPLGSSSSYETLSVAGKRAILERDDVTGYALAVALDAGEPRTLTFESRGVSREELTGFAESMVKAMAKVTIEALSRE